MFINKGKYSFILKSNLKNTKGVTLVELLVVLALLGMILSLGYSLNFLGMNIFTKGSSQANIQQKVRLASDFITKEVRYATDLKILNLSEPIPEKDNIEEDLYYIFIHDNIIEHRYKGNSKIITDEIQKLSFEKATDKITEKDIDNILNFEIVGNDKKQNYNIKSEALIMNLPKNSKILNENEDKPSIAICYKKTLPIESNPNEQWENYVLMTTKLTCKGSSNINAPEATIVVKDSPEDFEIKLSGGPSNGIIAKRMYTDQNINLIGSAILGTINNPGSFYIDGNVKLNGSAYIHGELYYTGNLKIPHWINISDNKVANIDFPDISMPSLKTKGWYTERGFTSNTETKDNMKYFGDSYTFQSWNSPWNDIFSDVVIVSKKNITLSGDVDASGILFAPNGKVTITGSSSFEGIVIAKEIHLSGNVYIKYKSYDLNNLPF